MRKLFAVCVVMLAWATVGFATPTEPTGPSFDCDKAQSRAELSICNNPDLAALDALIAEMFSDLVYEGSYSRLEDPAARDAMRDGQRDWLAVRNQCEYYRCLYDVMARRVFELRLYQSPNGIVNLPLEEIPTGVVNHYGMLQYTGVCNSSIPVIEASEIVGMDDYYGGKPRRFRIYDISCDYGAYNVTSAFYIENLETGEIVIPSFARFEVEYFNADKTPIEDEEAAVFSRLSGVLSNVTGNRLVNASFDPETHSIHSYFPYRGLGDAFSERTYEFIPDGYAPGFKLVKFLEDSDYASEIVDGVEKLRVAPFVIFDADREALKPQTELDDEASDGY